MSRQTRLDRKERRTDRRHPRRIRNYLLKVRVGTTRDLERFLTETIKAVDGVERTETLITLSTAKESWNVSL